MPTSSSSHVSFFESERHSDGLGGTKEARVEIGGTILEKGWTKSGYVSLETQRIRKQWTFSQSQPLPVYAKDCKGCFQRAALEPPELFPGWDFLRFPGAGKEKHRSLLLT